MESPSFLRLIKAQQSKVDIREKSKRDARPNPLCEINLRSGQIGKGIVISIAVLYIKKREGSNQTGKPAKS